ncbi:UTRA domain-containing protein, partial [Klebsiella pneumoniae]|nr:UTRA domain-containing protein [Klebsiella pneumoniae]
NVPEPLAVDPDAAPPRILPKEGVPAASYRYMRRVHRAGGQAYCVIDVYLANSCYRRAPDAFDSEMVIPVLGRVCGPELKKMSQSFRIMAADLVVARHLDLPVGAPVGEVRRVITDHDGMVIYLGAGQYRGDL